MRLIAPFLVSLGLWIPAVAHGQDAALAAFNAWCFKAGQTADGIRTRMEQDTSSPLPFDLIFWDLSIEPTTDDVPAGVEGRELLRGRVAVVHVGQRNNQTFLAVDRLFDGLGLPREG